MRAAMDEGARSPLRILAPVALIAFAIAFCVVVLTSGGAGGDDDGDRRSQRAGDTRGGGKRRPSKPASQREDELPSRSYTVQTGDTLGEIALKTGMTVEKLQELNPELDPQALVSGQKVKLRE